MLPRTAIQVVDLAFGDCGKGTVVDHLCRKHPDALVVRFNGGPQAAHNVVDPDGRHHTFAQFGSGSFVPGVRTLLSRFVLIEPYALLNEARHLDLIGVPDPLGRLSIDARCPVITPAHQAANRLRELARGAGAHGTCGVGVGETMLDVIGRPADVLRAGELADRRAVRAKLLAACERKAAELKDVIRGGGLGGGGGGGRGTDGPARGADLPASDPSFARAAATILEPTWVDAAVANYAEVARHAAILDAPAADRLLRESAALVFEGAQGVLLDENHGFHPHTTWSTTTFANADALLAEAGDDRPRVRLGVLRTYFTRHGAGPFVTEDASIAAAVPEPHNGGSGWQGRFRVGPFDAVAARYAIAAAGGVDGLAVTHLDRVTKLPPRVCTAYRIDADAGDDELFKRRHATVRDIRTPGTVDLDRQARLTARLAACRPKFADAPSHDVEAFVRVIEREVGVEVALTSVGPTANDKYPFRRAGS
ncbi:MAG TPA: adenylosuccinate synthetase [Humisphaera sp.]